MYDTWVEAIGRGEMAGVAMIDQSAAFDCVDHGILRDKLRLYGFDPGALAWVEDYLSHREQMCYVESFLSPPLAVSVGVPQGSILGPLIYCIFTNDFPETVHGEECPLEPAEPDAKPKFRCQCIECGGITVYADDSTYMVSDKDQASLSDKLSEKFTVMADYLTANLLKVNSNKTHLIVMTTEQYRRRHPTTVSIATEDGMIEATPVERLLGAFIHQDMKWTEYVRNNDNSLLHCLNQRLGALKKVSKTASFKASLTVGNGIFMSKMIFMIALWSGCQEFLIDALQVCQNKAARVITKRNISTPIPQLLKECGWRSVRQEMYYHSVLQVHKTLLTKAPVYLYDKLTKDGEYNCDTRQARNSSIKLGPSFQTKLSLCKNSFRWRGAAWYEALPQDIRGEQKIGKFKWKVNSWIKANIRI